jgi:AAA domain
MARAQNPREKAMIWEGGRVFLPRVLAFRLAGFEPKFSSEISMQLQGGPNVILGGNGLGKTTIIQSVVYGLTGGLSSELEKDKKQRWNHQYFRKRLDPDRLRVASVEVDFALGAAEFSVRRLFTSSSVAAFRASTKGEWSTGDPSLRAMERALQASGYRSVNDFAFITQRLLYLPESRRLIAWDTDAQVRLLMLLSPDVIDEAEFKQRRAELTKIDSAKRHVHVAVGHLKEQLRTELPAEEEDPRSQRKVTPQMPVRDLSSILELLQSATTIRQADEKQVAEIARDLSVRSEEVEALREQIEAREAAMILGTITQAEATDDLALMKLIEHGVCPACGELAPELQAAAQRHAYDKACMLCGTNQATAETDDPELETLHSQLKTKLAAQESLEEKFRTARKRVAILRQKEEQLQAELNQAQSTAPLLALLERKVPVALTGQDPKRLYADLQDQEAQYEAQLRRSKVDIEQEFSDFRQSIQARIAKFQKLYKEYATAFLGIECTLDEVQTGDRLLDLPRFVPNFDGTARDTADDCSEAQRFFLDIAFRMAMIAWVSSLVGAPASFFCETPETALDMSYVDNVVTMFKQFSAEGHALLLTSNIQADGLAVKLLDEIPKGERSARVLNLLEYGQLTEVHRQSLDDMRKVTKKSLT